MNDAEEMQEWLIRKAKMDAIVAIVKKNKRRKKLTDKMVQAGIEYFFKQERKA